MSAPSAWTAYIEATTDTNQSGPAVASAWTAYIEAAIDPDPGLVITQGYRLVRRSTPSTRVSTNYTGTNGAAWPSPWTTSLQGGTTGGVIDIQSNRGRMLSNEGTRRRARASATGVTVYDGTFEATFNISGLDTFLGYLWFRTSGDWVSGAEWAKNGYFLYIQTPNNLRIARQVGTTEHFIAEYPLNTWFWQAGVDYKAKVNFLGNSIKAKVWLASSSEPAGWTLEATDPTYTSGGVDISMLSGPTGDRQWTIDDVVVTTNSGWVNTIDRKIRLSGSWS
jgi:hypothetical protein